MTRRTGTARNGPVVKSRGVGVNFPRYQSNRGHKAPTDMRSAERRKILITNCGHLVTLFASRHVFTRRLYFLLLSRSAIFLDDLRLMLLTF